MKKTLVITAAVALLAQVSAFAVTIDWKRFEVAEISDVTHIELDIAGTGELTSFTSVSFRGASLGALMKLMPRVYDGEIMRYTDDRQVEIYAAGEKAVSLSCRKDRKAGPVCDLVISKGPTAG